MFRRRSRRTRAHDRGDLGGRRPGEPQRVGEQAVEQPGRQAQPLVGGQPGDQVVLGLPLLPHGQRHRHRVLLDHFVRRLPAHAGPHRGDQHRGGGQERQVAVELAGDHRRVRAELVEHGERGLEQPVEGEERVRQRDPADHRVGHVALVPLGAGQLAGHPGVAAQQHQHPVDPLGAARVHLVRHRRRADLAGLEALGGQLDAGHQPDRGGQRRRRGGQLDERGEHVEVERARVDLADAGQLGGEPQVRGDPRAPARPACAASPPSRSSMSCAVPIGPLMPRSG